MILNSTRFFLLNIIVLILLHIVANLNSNYTDGLFLMISILIQFMVNLSVSAIYNYKKNDKLSKSFFLYSGIVLIIGFSTCLSSI